MVNQFSELSRCRRCISRGINFASLFSSSAHSLMLSRLSPTVSWMILISWLVSPGISDAGVHQ